MHCIVMACKVLKFSNLNLAQLPLKVTQTALQKVYSRKNERCVGFKL